MIRGAVSQSTHVGVESAARKPVNTVWGRNMRMPTLYQFFRHQLSHGFAARGLAEPATVDYVSDVLTRFAQTRALYAITDAHGRPLEYVVDFLSASRDDETHSANRGRGHPILRHLGEYTLFMSGLFRERLSARGELGYYLVQGASAYGQCADRELHPGRRHLFHRIHDNFARIADTLDDMRRARFPLRVPATAENMVAALWRV